MLSRRRHYGPPTIKGNCRACGSPHVTTEVVYTWVPTPRTGSRQIHKFCDAHGREFHNATAVLFGNQLVAH